MNELNNSNGLTMMISDKLAQQDVANISTEQPHILHHPPAKKSELPDLHFASTSNEYVKQSTEIFIDTITKRRNRCFQKVTRAQ